MSIPREFIDLLLSKIDLVDLINTQVPLQKKSGSNYFARCPFHQEKSASFSVSQTKQFYYCFGCGAHGNAIDFLIQHERLSFPEAVQTLARTAGMEVPQSAHYQHKKEDSLPALFELMTSISTYYYEAMRHSERAIHYLKNRGISGTIAQQFNLGYAAPGWSHLLDTFGKTEAEKKTLLELGLIIQKQEGGYYDRFRDRILFPIRDYRGRIIGFGGRVIDQGEPKYLNSPETILFQKGHELYGLYQALKTNRHLPRVLIVEGYMDVIALFQHGLTYAVATMGTATTPHHLQRLFRYTADLVFCFDGDQAGRLAADRALKVIFPMMHDQLQVRFLFLPEGEDPDSLVRQEGPARFEERMQTAPSLSAYFFQTLSKQCEMSTLEGRAKFANLALEQIKQLPKSLFQNMLLEELSKRARINIQKLALSESKESAYKTQKHELNLPSPLKLVLALLIQHPSLAQGIKEMPPPSALEGHSFLIQLIEIIHQSPHITTGRLIEYWRDKKEQQWIAELAEWEHLVPAKGLEKELAGALKQLTLLSLDVEINHLLAKAASGSLNHEEKEVLTKAISKKKAVDLAENP